MTRFIFLLLLSAPSLSTAAVEQTLLYDFLNTTQAKALLVSGVSIKPLELNQQEELLRRIVFESTPQIPILTINTHWNLLGSKTLSLRIQNAMDWDVTLYITLKDTNNTALNAIIALPAGPAQNLVIPLHATSSRTWGMREGITSWQTQDKRYFWF